MANHRATLYNGVEQSTLPGGDEEGQERWRRLEEKENV
jgi:hypothetical protein